MFSGQWECKFKLGPFSDVMYVDEKIVLSIPDGATHISADWLLLHISIKTVSSSFIEYRSTLYIEMPKVKRLDLGLQLEDSFNLTGRTHKTEIHQSGIEARNNPGFDGRYHYLIWVSFCKVIPSYPAVSDWNVLSL